MLTINDIITVLTEASADGEIDPPTFVKLLGRFNIAIASSSVATMLQEQARRGIPAPTPPRQRDPSESRRGASEGDEEFGVIVTPYPPSDTPDDKLPTGEYSKVTPAIITPHVIGPNE